MNKIKKMFCWPWKIYCIYKNGFILARYMNIIMFSSSSIISSLLVILVIGLKLLLMFIIPMIFITIGVFTFFYPNMADPLLSDKERLEILTKIEGELQSAYI